MIVSKKKVKVETEKRWRLDFKISSPDDVATAVRKITEKEVGGDEREHFIAVALNTKNKITGYYIVSIGTVNSSLVHPREVLRFAIAQGATAFIVAHNHPSGQVDPSQEDIKVTERLREAGALVGIPLLDHIIVGDNDHYSFKADGMI